MPPRDNRLRDSLCRVNHSRVRVVVTTRNTRSAQSVRGRVQEGYWHMLCM